jgi:hypothetical protein
VHSKPLRPRKRRSSFEAIGVRSDLRWTEHALNLGQEVGQFPFKLQTLRACVDKIQELFPDQIFERTREPETPLYVTRCFALLDPLPMKLPF